MGKGSESEEHLESPKGECGRRGSQRGNRKIENSVTNFTLAEWGKNEISITKKLSS